MPLTITFTGKLKYREYLKSKTRKGGPNLGKLGGQTEILKSIQSVNWMTQRGIYL